MQGNLQNQNAHAKSRTEIIYELKSDKTQGISEQEAALRLSYYGENEFEEKKKRSLLSCFFSQFADFMILVLIAAAVISFLVSVFNHEADFVDSVIILAIVVLNAVMGVLQERKAEQSLAALKKISAPSATVIREGKKKVIPAKFLVPGDVIEVEAGELVPADARILTSESLCVDESALTGESVSVEKNGIKICEKETGLAEQENMLFSTSIVTMGHGTAMVVATGMHTVVGRIANQVLNENAPDTPLQKRLAKTGKYLGIMALGICAVMFLVGVLQKRPPFDMFLISVSLAVAAIPEALPGLVTIMLSLGTQRLAKKNAVIRHLPAVETLGTATYVCSDKTGTLTKNEMTLEAVRGVKGKLSKDREKKLLCAAVLCSNAFTQMENGTLKYCGEATEKAILRALYESGVHKSVLDSKVKRIHENPFDSEKKYMMTSYQYENGTFSIYKGAPEVLLNKCNYYEGEDGCVYLTEQDRHEIQKMVEKLSEGALRVLAVAYERKEKTVFLGLLGFLDPPRENVAECIKSCYSAGITPVMITGDHVMTACAIAKKIGMVKEDREQKEYAITGKELQSMSEDTLLKEIKKYRVFARVSPEHKVRILKALQRHGEIVAMTGDGVNDAAALKTADIGCAMGLNGTDVAKNAADMVLMDDNFVTIVEAIKEGRGIYDNIRKAVHFLLSCNIGEILTIFAAILLRIEPPLVAVQLLWVNLVTDSLPALALAAEPPEAGIMRRKPTKSAKSFFSDGMVGKIVLEGMLIGFLALTAYLIGGRSYAFAVLSFSQLFHAYNMRSSHSLFQIGVFGNRKMNLAFVVCAILQASVLSVEKLANLFQCSRLGVKDWGIVLLLSIVPVLLSEVQKKYKD